MATYSGNKHTFVDPRNLYGDLIKAADQTPGYGTSYNATSGGGGTPSGPDQDPTGQNSDPSGAGTGVPSPYHGGSTGDFWQDFLNVLKGTKGLSADNYNLISSNQAKLAPMLEAAMKAFGGSGNILKYMGYNPMKGAYTALSYLTGNPYYDKGNAADGSEYWNPFYVPGFDYDPATPGVQAPGWAKGQVKDNPGGWVT